MALAGAGSSSCSASCMWSNTLQFCDNCCIPKRWQQKISWTSKIHYQEAATLSCSVLADLHWLKCSSFISNFDPELFGLQDFTCKEPRKLLQASVWACASRAYQIVSYIFAWNSRSASSVAWPMTKPRELLLYLGEAESVHASFHSCFTGPLERLVVVLITLK